MLLLVQAERFGVQLCVILTTTQEEKNAICWYSYAYVASKRDYIRNQYACVVVCRAAQRGEGNSPRVPS
jgi:hypothetical protein